MKCPHCLVEFAPSVEWIQLQKDADGEWAIEKYLCPNEACNKFILYLVKGKDFSQRVGFISIIARFLFRPKGISRSPVPPQVPSQFAEDYREACLVLPDSPKASAALSRCCLQNMLREVAQVKPGNLVDEIQQVLDSKSLPTYLAEPLHMVREIGNFAAHPIKNQKTGEIIPVKPGEAECNLDVLEGLFDFYFVQPEIMKKKKEALNQKLQAAGKKEIT